MPRPRSAGGPGSMADELADFNAAVEKPPPITGSQSVICAPAISIWPRLKSSGCAKPGACSSNVRRQTAGRFRRCGAVQHVFTDVSVRLVTVDFMIKLGKPDAVRQSLGAIRADLYDLRNPPASSVPDCVLKANGAMDELMVYNDRTLNYGPNRKSATASPARPRLRSVLDRCDSMASGRCARVGIPPPDRRRQGRASR